MPVRAVTAASRSMKDRRSMRAFGALSSAVSDIGVCAKRPARVVAGLYRSRIQTIDVAGGGAGRAAPGSAGVGGRGAGGGLRL